MQATMQVCMKGTATIMLPLTTEKKLVVLNYICS